MKEVKNSEEEAFASSARVLLLSSFILTIFAFLFFHRGACLCFLFSDFILKHLQKDVTKEEKKLWGMRELSECSFFIMQVIVPSRYHNQFTKQRCEQL